MKLLDGRKVYAFCILTMISIPLVDKFVHPLSFEFIFFNELLFAYFFFNRSTQQKSYGHKLSRHE